jgi:hypothetical protein
VDMAREGKDIPAVGVSVRKSAFRFVLASTARRALRFEEEAADWLVVALGEEWAAAKSALEVAAFEAAGVVVVGWGWILKDERRVIEDLSLLF